MAPRLPSTDRDRRRRELDVNLEPVLVVVADLLLVFLGIGVLWLHLRHQLTSTAPKDDLEAALDLLPAAGVACGSAQAPKDPPPADSLPWVA
jgi:hypothetical protein